MGSVRDTENIFNPEIFLIAIFKVWNVRVVFWSVMGQDDFNCKFTI